MLPVIAPVLLATVAALPAAADVQQAAPAQPPSYATVTILSQPVHRALPAPKPDPHTDSPSVSRSADRPDITTPNAPVVGGSPQAIAKAMVNDDKQFACLDHLWTKESGWNPTIANASSGAYGIPQALPGSKMASAGSDWKTNPATQIKWGLGYIKSTYGSPCAAWAHSQAVNWY